MDASTAHVKSPYSMNIKDKGFQKILGVGLIGMIMLCACGGYSSLSPEDAYDAAYSTSYGISRLINGN